MSKLSSASGRSTETRPGCHREKATACLRCRDRVRQTGASRDRLLADCAVYRNASRWMATTGARPQRPAASTPTASHGANRANASESTLGCGPRRRRVWLERFLELDPRITDVAQPPLRILLEAALQYMTNGGRHSRRQCRPLRLPVDDGREHVGGRLSDEWTAAAEHFVEHAPERPDVRTFVDRLPPGLLRTHVGGGPDHDLIAGLTGGTGGRLVVRVQRNLGLTDLRHAEVQYLNDAVGGDLDIGRLQITMNDPFLVRSIQRVRDLNRDAKRLGHAAAVPRSAVPLAWTPQPVRAPTRARHRPQRSRRSRRRADG